MRPHTGHLAHARAPEMSEGEAIMSKRVGLSLLIALLTVVEAACTVHPSSVLADTASTDGTDTGSTADGANNGDTIGTGDSGGTTTGATGGSTASISAAGATLAASLLSQAEIAAQLSAIGDLQRQSAETKDQQIASALKRVKAYRMLVGLRTDVTIDANDTELAEAAADICMRLGTLTHTPSRPPGMTDVQYNLAQQGAGESNLASGYPHIGIPQSIDFYMDDSDSGNIDRVGHRRWIMSPFLTHTGFGLSSDGHYTATHVFPESSLMSACFSDPDAIQPWNYILYPRWGYMPLEYFAAADVAWSISLRPDLYNATYVTAASINIRAVDTDGNATASRLTISYFTRSTVNYGCQAPVLIFRPDGLIDSPGMRYRVTVSDITTTTGSPSPLDYWVEFFTAGVSTFP
jgi:hypothetical protein